MIVIDSWKRIDRENRNLDIPEQVYEFNGFVAQPPLDVQKCRIYSEDKIQEV